MKRVFLEFPRKYGLEPDLDTYNTVLKGFSESGSTNSAHSILAEMERKGVKPNATTFSVVIAGFDKEEKLSDVESMMRLMKKYGMRPNISIHNAQIQSLCKLKRSDEAKALLDEIVSRGMKPNCVTYARLIYGFCKENKLDVAKSLFKEMVVDKKLKPEADCYFMLVYFLCQGRDFEAAFEKVDEAREIIGVVKDKFSKNAEKCEKGNMEDKRVFMVVFYSKENIGVEKWSNNMEDPKVMKPTNNNKALVIWEPNGCNTNLESQLRQVCFSHVLSGIVGLLIFGGYAAMCLSVVISTPDGGATGLIIIVTVFLLLGVIVSIIEIVVNSWFVYLIDRGRGDRVRAWRRNKLVRALHWYDGKKGREFKAIELQQQMEQEDNRQTNPTPCQLV
ncbi:pentatricopeptide repeat-containing protein at1g61870 mitochondrial [Phtheirospermum japonicum]|uniref:Pentatricopeptide repeat-containing protein at1g61870 mitochondrial n=1 Tax=Phtheirospermum japonicum TaxID=374723 RepID=A0A830BTP1_9LAMI|nr:pentatricopeptide repeat-containing protein at1g61870 mitochondrial [Phtheirospermum japonicum]